MASLDSNVLVRLLTADDPAQTGAVIESLARVEAADETLFVPSTVFLELEWVLRSRYRFDKPRILTALSSLMETRELDFEDEHLLEQALAIYRARRADFAECLHAGAALRHERAPLLTFDRDEARLPGAALLGG